MAVSKEVEKLLGKLQRKYGETAAVRLSDDKSTSISEVIPTGIEALDKYVLGCGGFPIGRISEVYGIESAGKSSLVASCIASVQRLGGIAGLCDAEKAFTPGRALLMGADPEGVIMLDPPNLEEGGNMMFKFLEMLPGTVPALLVLDSVPALPTRAELKGEPSDIHMGERARFYSTFCTFIVKKLVEKRCHMLFVNQTRMKLGVRFGDPETTPGGQAVKFYATHRLRMRGGKVENGGLNVYIKCKKNKVSEPGRDLETKLNFESGWNDLWTTINHAKNVEAVPADLKVTPTNCIAAREALGWAAPEVEDATLRLAGAVPPAKTKKAKKK